MTRRALVAYWPMFICLACVAPLAADEPSEVFNRLDKNKDGKITRDEMPEQLRPIFERIDTNHDGAISPEEQRQFAQRRAAATAQAPRVADSIRAELDIPYAATDNPRQRLDLYLPKHPKGDKPLPVVAFIHGGGWRAGDKGGGYWALASLVQSGEFAGVSIGYRLSDQAIWPAQIYDCKAAIRWLRANAKKYNLDPERIGVVGPSAGGHLVAMLGTSGDVKEMEGDLGPNTGVSSRVACVVDEFGPTDLLAFHNAGDTPKDVLAGLLGGPIKEKQELAQSASPLTYVTKDDPPMMLIHGTKDSLVPIEQSEVLQAALQKVGVEAVLIRVEGAGHGFRSPEPAIRMRQFFENYLLGRDQKISTEPVKETAPPPRKG